MNTSKAILITRSMHDLINRYFYYWTDRVIVQAKRKRVGVLDLKNQKANNSTFTSYIKKNNPRIVFFNGHGNDDVIAGNNDDILVKIGNNEELLAEKIVYARSCDAANNLGHACIKKHTASFIGYKKKYTLAFDRSKITRPLHDSIAKLFLEPSNLVPISLVKGNSAMQAYEKSQAAMKRNFLYMLSTNASSEEKDVAVYLCANKKYQVVLGDQEAHI